MIAPPGGEVTSMTRDAYGRVREQSDPDRGMSATEYDGFGESTAMVGMTEPMVNGSPIAMFGAETTPRSASSMAM